MLIASSRSVAFGLLLLLLITCFVATRIDQDHEDYVQIYDDFGEPIGSPIRKVVATKSSVPSNTDINERDYEYEEDESTNSDKDEEPATRDANRNRDQTPGENLPITHQSDGNMKSQTNSEPRSLLVKVYRGPTKQVNKKPFASWGYFVKFPTEDSSKANNGS